MVNVLGDSIGAGIVYHLSRDELPPLENTQDAEVSSDPSEPPSYHVETDNGDKKPCSNGATNHSLKEDDDDINYEDQSYMTSTF